MLLALDVIAALNMLISMGTRQLEATHRVNQQMSHVSFDGLTV
jgi:hypothetical protein